MIKYSLIIPCYNEEDNLSHLINECKPILSKPECEVILVNNGSTDKSIKVMNRYKKIHSNLKIIDLKINKGYGGGIIKGLSNASGEIIGWTHADNQTSPVDFLKAIPFFKKEKNSFVKGFRYGRSLSDYFFSYGMGLFESFLLKKWMIEINAQPTVFRRDFFEKWNNPPKDFSLDLYAYYMAILEKLKICRIKVFFGPRMYGNSKWNFGIKSKFKFIKRTVMFSYQLKKMFNENNNS